MSCGSSITRNNCFFEAENTQKISQNTNIIYMYSPHSHNISHNTSRDFHSSYFLGLGCDAFFFSPVSKAASICWSFAKSACFSAPNAAKAVCTRAVSIYVRPVSIVAGLFDRELCGTLERELLGTSDFTLLLDSGTLADEKLRTDSGASLALLGVSLLNLAELSLLELDMTNFWY